MAEPSTTPTDVLKDVDGAYSSKRTYTAVALLAFLALVGVDVWQSATTGRAPTQYIVDALMYIIAAGFGFSASERWAPK